MSKATSNKALATLPTGTLTEIATGDSGWSVQSWSGKRPAADVIAVGQVATNVDGLVEYMRGVAAHNALTVSGLVGENGEFKTRGDLQNALGLASAGMLSRAEMLGRAAVVHGVQPGSKRWTRIARAVRGSGTHAAAVKDALRSDSKTPAATLDRLLSTFEAPPAAVPAPAPEAEAENNGSDITASATPERLDKATPEARLNMVRQCLTTVGQIVGRSDAATLRQIVDALATASADAQAALAEMTDGKSKSA